ncbi:MULTISPECIES: FixH family protein [Neobacillus]|uniref:FixH family protein n=1 Tax=Neobacillus rhizophilus TaxID=2833579 RepID=A0A942U9H2_9BACI|nr:MULTISPECIES: FixH family protein [Neobacillus]MBS4216005.1 FixH family protein [Neobacillus rhizophilus]MBU8916098.1 FixH family protein [Bacillus sp. FJAT-29953]
MKKYLWCVLSILFLILAASCGKQENHNAANKPPQIIEVALTIKPEKAEPNKPVIFEAKVTQGKEAVEDADEVTFEIWRSKDEKHEKINVKHAENGIYRLEKSFPTEGTYYVISHVTARDMHSMPKKDFVVGTPSEPEDPNASHSNMDMKGHDNSTNGH